MEGSDHEERRRLRTELALAAAFTDHGLNDDGDPGLEETLSPAAQLVDLSERALHMIVLRAREQGASWAEIGENLGITRQAAQKRFAGKVPQKVSAERPQVPPQIIDEATRLLDAAAAGHLDELDKVASEHIRKQCGPRGLAPHFQAALDIYGSLLGRDHVEVTMLGRVVLLQARERREKQDARAEISLTVDGLLLGLQYHPVKASHSEES